MKKNAAEDYSTLYSPEEDFDVVYTRFTAKRICKAIKPGQQVLEMGSATSHMTEFLVKAGAKVDCVERWERYIKIAKKKKLPGVNFYQSDMEDFEAEKKYDHIIFTNVIHELYEREAVLKKASKWLKKSGKIHITMPNPESIHRKAALYAGMIDSLADLGPRGEKYHAVKLLYNDEVVKLVQKATGLKCTKRDGVLLKPLPNDSMQKLAPKVLEAFDKLASEFIENSGMSYFVFSKRTK
ncbi:MAG: class I SAM-dependent methyltransferase [Proteobacteria bacterium]|nr:class I SAM-dependent methyltransferase [Pseudomonadota bacterium]